MKSLLPVRLNFATDGQPINLTFPPCCIRSAESGSKHTQVVNCVTFLLARGHLLSSLMLRLDTYSIEVVSKFPALTSLHLYDPTCKQKASVHHDLLTISQHTTLQSLEVSGETPGEYSNVAFALLSLFQIQTHSHRTRIYQDRPSSRHVDSPAS